MKRMDEQEVRWRSGMQRKKMALSAKGALVK